MSDDQMDARLRLAGETWRANNTDTVTPARATEPLADTRPPARRPRRRFGLVASAALVAAAVAVGGTVLVQSLTGNRSDQSATPLAGTVWRYDGGVSYATLVIDGNGNLVVDDECAVLAAKAVVLGDRLDVTHPDLRYRYCTDQYGPILLTAKIGVLTGNPRWSIDGKRLTIGSLHFTATDVPAPTLDVPTFQGSHWLLIGVSDAKGRDVPFPGNPELYVHAGKLLASDSCNTLSGRATTRDGRTIVVSNVASTDIACLNNKAAPIIDDLLTKPFSPGVGETEMTIRQGNIGMLSYRWLPGDADATDPAGLTGITWHLQSVAMRDAIGTATLRIGADGRLTGNDGCEEIAARISVDVGLWVATGLPEVAPGSCPKALRDQATTVLSFLRDGLWSVRDGRLIVGGGGAQAFSLVYTSGSSTPTYPALTSKTWKLTSWSEETTQGATSSGSGASVVADVRLSFDGKSIRITDRCGTYTVPTGVSATALTVGRLTYNTHSCPALPSKELRAAEVAVRDHISAVFHGRVTWRIRGSELTLTRAGTSLTFAVTGTR